MRNLCYSTVLAIIWGLIVIGYAPRTEASVGLATGSGTGTFDGFGITLNGSGANDLVSIDPGTGAVTVVGAGLPSGIQNFTATLDSAGSRYFYRSSDNLIAVDSQTGALLYSLPSSENLLSISKRLTKAVTVEIDIKPDSFPNSINPRSNGKVTVAILTSDTFEAANVDEKTVRFGPTGTEAIPIKSVLTDVDKDGDVDMIFDFNTQDTGILCGDISVFLTGKTLSEHMFEGSDSIRTVGCN